MKKFTCREIMNGDGGCDMEFAGAEMMDVASQCDQHVAQTTNEAHRPMREMMTNPNHTKEDQTKWFAWFQGEWDKKADL